jgi:predicted RNA-binding Zn-ribbon protein involved in translation (DUF1610 family)
MSRAGRLAEVQAPAPVLVGSQMPKFVCPQCGREVVSSADLEGRAADCAQCGVHVTNWPAPLLSTRKPRSRLFEFGIALALVFALIVVGATKIMAVIAIVTVAALILRAVTRR